MLFLFGFSFLSSFGAALSVELWTEMSGFPQALLGGITRNCEVTAPKTLSRVDLHVFFKIQKLARTILPPCARSTSLDLKSETSL